MNGDCVSFCVVVVGGVVVVVWKSRCPKVVPSVVVAVGFGSVVVVVLSTVLSVVAVGALSLPQLAVSSSAVSSVVVMYFIVFLLLFVGCLGVVSRRWLRRGKHHPKSLLGICGA